MAGFAVGITGASGLVGRKLQSTLAAEGHTVYRLIRKPGPTPESCEFSLPDVPLDFVIHLAGEPVAALRWNDAKKARIRESRITGTLSISRAIAEAVYRPQALISASAAGFYGNRGNEILDENSPAGRGFLAEVAQAWETATRPASECGLRVVNLRFGMILSAEGGALAKMLPAFRCGLGGRIGNGQQFWSWISLDDAIGAIRHIMFDNSIQGPVNVVAPEPVTNAEFTESLAHALKRPAIMHVPHWLIKILAGEMAEELLLASIRAVPQRLLQTNYQFQHKTLQETFAAIFGT